jgi:hypothetical protein
MNKEGGLIIFNRFLKTLIFMTGLCLLPLKQSQQVDASPWVLPKERLVVSATTGFSRAQHEFINDKEGTRQRFPLEGDLRVYSLRLGSRYGLKDKLELEVTATFQALTYSAESFIKDDKLIGLNTSEMGLGDIELKLTRQLISGQWPLSFQGGIKLPTGYSIPQPNRLALGSGQADLIGVLQFGHLFSNGTLLGVEGGGVLRLKGPGHQLKYSVKVAQRLVGHTFIFVAQSGLHSMTDGENTGLFNRVSKTPLLEADLFNIEDTYLLPFSLTQDLHQLELGFFLGTQSKVEYSAALIIPWAGRNVTQVISFFWGINHPL